MRAAVAVLLFAAACATPASSPRAGDLAAPDAAAAADLATSDLAGAAAPAVCGNGDCEPGESGASCGSDCCDAMTSCDASRGNGGAFFCRSMNGGPFAWYTQADTTALCASASQIGKTTWACAQRAGYCCSVPGGFVDGPCP
ncbi:MAG TPA: hypothetical protein VF945_15545 [Polyangia bacterium]